MPVVAMWTPEDGLLGALAPVAMALAAPGPALVVDLDAAGPAYPGQLTLASMVADGGPRRGDLEPGGRSLAVLGNGGIGARPEAVVAHLAAAWPFCVLRLPPRPRPAGLPWPVVPVAALYPDLVEPPQPPAVYQDAGWGVTPPGPGVRLPRPRPATWRALAAGRRPVPDRWLRAWRRVWGLPWR